MASVDLKHPVTRALPFRLFVLACLGLDIAVHLVISPSPSALACFVWLMIWTLLCNLARRWDSARTALQLHLLEAAFLPGLVMAMSDPLAAGALLIALAGPAALGGWRFLVPSAAVMLGSGTLLFGFPQPQLLATLLLAGFLLPIALVSFSQAQRLHRQGSAARHRSENLGRTNAHLEKYLPERVRDRVRLGVSGRELPHTCWASVVFVDLVGFTGYVRRRPSAEIMAVVDDYQAALSALVTARSGVLGKFLGDGALIYFPQRQSRSEEALRCLMLAQSLPALVSQLNLRLRCRGYLTQLKVRTGIASGYCALGDWGGDEHDRLDHCIIGDSVNLASRLQQAADPDGGLVCEVTAALVEAAVVTPPEGRRLLGESCYLELKGLGRTPAYRLVDAAIGHL